MGVMTLLVMLRLNLLCRTSLALHTIIKKLHWATLQQKQIFSTFLGRQFFFPLCILWGPARDEVEDEAALLEVTCLDALAKKAMPSFRSILLHYAAFI
jgi:hypothetical protein